MKFNIFIISVIILAVLSNNIYTRKTTSRSRSQINPPKGIDSLDNLVYQFLSGALAEVGGAYSLIDGCPELFADHVNKVSGAEIKKSTMEKISNNLNKKFDKVLTYLGPVLNVVCTLKRNYIFYFRKKAVPVKPKRLFINKEKTATRFDWNFETYLKDNELKIKSKASEIASSGKKFEIVDGVDVTKKKAGEMNQYLRDKITGALQPIIDLLEDIRKPLLRLFTKKPIFVALLKFSNCFVKNPKIKDDKKLLNILTGYNHNIAKLESDEGWVRFTIHLICGWKVFRDAINFLKLGIAEAEAQKPKKYNFFGRFAGKMMRTLRKYKKLPVKK
jgi:hypothetical protein